MLIPVVAGAQSLVVVASPRFETYVAPPVNAALQVNAINGGLVRLAVQWNSEGRPVDWLVLAYSERIFADSVLAAVPEWRLVPPKVNGQPVSGYTEIEFSFKGPDVTSFTVSDTVEMLFSRAGVRRLAYRPCPLRDLDRIPLPLNSVAPVYGKDLKERGIQGAVEVRFCIDENGTVRMPAVVSADHPRLAESALAAVRQWKFDPPTSHGAPVLILAQQRFDFGAAQPAEPGEQAKAPPAEPKASS